MNQEIKTIEAYKIDKINIGRLSTTLQLWMGTDRISEFLGIFMI